MFDYVIAESVVDYLLYFMAVTSVWNLLAHFAEKLYFYYLRPIVVAVLALMGFLFLDLDIAVGILCHSTTCITFCFLLFRN